MSVGSTGKSAMVHAAKGWHDDGRVDAPKPRNTRRERSADISQAACFGKGNSFGGQVDDVQTDLDLTVQAGHAIREPKSWPFHAILGLRRV